jgi:BirA family biotin operon repressor/biotin-[acetyl-CoA-carboxylase] ligase
VSDPLPDDLERALADVRAAGRLRRLATSVTFFHRTSSTNDVAASLAGAGACEGPVVIADAQTAGRGRRGRQWFSPPVGGLYVSAVVAPVTARVNPARATALVTLAAGVAIAEAIEATTGLAADMKWPNDLLTGGRKLAGILAEGVASSDPTGGGRLQAVVLGYGINVGPMVLPPDLATRATALDQELGRHIDRARLCAETLAALEARYGDLLDGRFDAILDAWRRRAPSSRGVRVRWDAGARSGLTAGVDDDGALLVRTPDGLERITSGEVTWT